MQKAIWMHLAVKLRLSLLAVAVGFTAVIIWLTAMEVSSALAREGAGTGTALLEQPELQQTAEPEVIYFGIYFTDPSTNSITDLSGNVIGEGRHTGQLRCILGNCSQKTKLSFASTSPLISTAEYDYKFKTLHTFDLEGRTAVVTGSGTIYNGEQKERFLFTATIQDNRDGTLAVTYVASRPEASFIIPESLGRLEIRSRQ